MITENYLNVCQSVQDSCSLSHRNPENITLVAVSKTHPPEHIIPLLQAQHIHFGENRVQEAQLKWPALKQNFPLTKLHLIGPLQSNKAKQALQLFDFIHTIDRTSIIRALAKAQHHTQKKPTCLIQVNSGHEPQKAGVLPENFSELLNLSLQNHLNIQGVMCIPPIHQDPLPHFLLCSQLANTHNLPIQSFGMSNDFQKAISCHSTLIRVGSAIFGKRQENFADNSG